jgi:hypothetical protein
VDELKKAGGKVLIDKPVERPTGRGLYFFDTERNYNSASVSGVRNGF